MSNPYGYTYKVVKQIEDEPYSGANYRCPQVINTPERLEKALNFIDSKGWNVLEVVVQNDTYHIIARIETDCLDGTNDL